MSAILKELLYNDGEALDFNDLNNAQRYERAYINDAVLQNLIRVNSQWEDPAISQLYAFPGCGSVLPVGTGLAITNLAGTVYQKTFSGIDGDDPLMLAYNLAADELLTTLAAADATNPRYDIIQVKLSQEEADSTSRDFKDATTGVITTSTTNKTRRVKLDFSVKQGTPAGSPSFPSIDSGYVEWARVYVRAAATTLSSALNLTNNDIWDMIRPIGYTECTVAGEDGTASGGSWAPLYPYAGVDSSSGASDMLFVPRGVDIRSSLLAGIRISGIFGADTTFDLVQVSEGGSITSLYDLTSALAGVGSATTHQERRVSMTSLYHVWGNSYRCGPGYYADGVSGVKRRTIGLRVRKAASATTVQIDTVGFQFFGG